jgi:hypothetical protein
MRDGRFRGAWQMTATHTANQKVSPERQPRTTNMTKNNKKKED